MLFLIGRRGKGGAPSFPAPPLGGPGLLHTKGVDILSAHSKRPIFEAENEYTNDFPCSTVLPTALKGWPSGKKNNLKGIKLPFVRLCVWINGARVGGGLIRNDQRNENEST